MSLLKEINDIVKESAAAGAVGAHSVAGHAGSLFGGGVISRIRDRKKFKRAMKLVPSSVNTIRNPRNAYKWQLVAEASDYNKPFNTFDVLSKLDAAEKQARSNQDTQSFGLEDSDGNIVKVIVRADQAEEFEKALANMLAGLEDDPSRSSEDGEPAPIEIAEVLFRLKDRFEIVDVVWPPIEGDVEEEEEENVGEEPEEEQEDAGEEGDDDLADLESDLADLEGGEEGGEESEKEEPEMKPEGGVEQSLQQIVDLLKSQADAQRAEAEAKAAEAEAEAAKAQAEIAAAKVKQEEEVLDMEAYNSKKKEQESEAKRLAALAKYKHEVAADMEAQVSADKEETKDDMMDQVADLLKKSRSGEEDLEDGDLDL